ncbi:hypothetical protein BGZ76_011831 [Entomortierella beljakovae]|nr:hypothetical protein BGZ76_011831 [Entomortierella beljakovae]
MHLDLKQAASGRISSRTLQRYLCHNEHLVQLQARSVVIMVEDMINTSTVELLPWKCKNLKSLSVAFGLTWPRDDEQLLHNDGGFVSRESCFTWGERCVYRQLSMLTHLEVLDIPQSFLTVREGTGFEMLTSLSKMEEFSIAGSRINQVERLPTGWFQQHWPKANKVVVASRIYFLKAAPASGLSSNISFMERRKSC